MIPREFKGKARAIAQMEGNGGAEGIVLPLHVVGSITDIAYTIEVTAGTNQNLFLQVDTGSSDLWIVSKSCPSSACGQTSGHIYDPSGSRPTGQDFKIQYIQGTVSGPIVWDKFVVGGYSLDSQALAAADTVIDEPLGPNFSGILGLALPLNSIIAQLIPPVTSNSPDGAAWASNLFSITPVSSAPSARFLSLLLSRPGFDNGAPAQLGIGRHPSFISDPSTVEYNSLVSEMQGTLFWKVDVRAITVWVDGEERPVQIGGSNTGGFFPSAVLDSGVPLILTTRALANGIYGAIGIGPGSDGNYYVPCTTPLNLTITLDDRSPIPLHPLDLTSDPQTDNSASSCIGIIQAADSVLTQPNSPADIILGVPFLRNTYTVMAYEPPDDFGISSSSNSTGNIKPRLGLLGITDPTKALDEFHSVRVLKKPPNPSSGPDSNSPSSGGGVTVGKHVSVGIIVLVSLLGFFALCIGLFGVRWWFTRRRYRQRFVKGEGAPSGSTTGLPGLGRTKEKEGGYAYARASTRGSKDMSKIPPGKELYIDEETMRSGRWEPYMEDHGWLGSSKEIDEQEQHDENAGKDEEMGMRGRRNEVWSEGGDTLVEGRSDVVRPHERTLSTEVPLLQEIKLQRTRSPSGSGSSSRSHRGLDEFGVLPHIASGDVVNDAEEGAGDRTSMAGVGTAARGSKIGPWNERSGSGEQP